MKCKALSNPVCIALQEKLRGEDLCSCFHECFRSSQYIIAYIFCLGQSEQPASRSYCMGTDQSLPYLGISRAQLSDWIVPPLQISDLFSDSH